MFKFTEGKLAREIGRVAHRIDPLLSFDYLPTKSEVTLTKANADGSSGKFKLYLGNLFPKISKLSRKDRIPAIEEYLRGVLEPEELSPDQLVNSLALRIRTGFEIDVRIRQFELLGQEAEPSIIMPQGDLLIEVVSDREGAVSMTPKGDLAKIGVSDKEAIQIATAKLRQHTDVDQWELIDDLIWLSRYQDDYDFARLVAAGEYRRFPFEGTPIVFAPSHTICLVTTTMDDSVLARMTDIGNAAAAEHRPFSQLLWTLRPDGTWGRLQPQESKVAALQAALETISQYEETKEYLEQAITDDVFIAGYHAYQNNEELASYCTYTLDLPSYLPQTDFVAIVNSELANDDGIVGRVDWAEFVGAIGSESIERVVGLEPAWFRVQDALPQEQKERLSSLARPLT